MNVAISGYTAGRVRSYGVLHRSVGNDPVGAGMYRSPTRAIPSRMAMLTVRGVGMTIGSFRFVAGGVPRGDGGHLAALGGAPWLLLLRHRGQEGPRREVVVDVEAGAGDALAHAVGLDEVDHRDARRIVREDVLE